MHTAALAPPLPRDDVASPLALECIYPASLNQEMRLLFDEVDAGQRIFRSPHFPITFRIRGLVDRALLERAFNDVIQRHENLRTSFVRTPRYSARDRAMQLAFFRRSNLFIPGLYYQALDVHAYAHIREWEIDSADDATLARVVEDEVTEASSGDAPHKPRALLVRTDPDMHLLIVVMSHLLADGWSVQIFQRELIALYTAHVRGQANPLQPVRAQYREFAIAQHRAVVSGELDREASFWLRQWNEIGDANIAHHDVPFGRGVAAPPLVKMHKRVIGPAESAAIADVTRRLRTTPYMVFRTAIAIVLHCLTGKRRVAFWANFANRRASYENTFGWCANTHLVVTAVTPDSLWTSLCRHVAEVTLECQAHEALPLAALWRYTGRNLAADANTRINFDFWPVTRRTVTPLALEPILVPGGRRWMDLDLRLRHDDCGFALIATYNSSRYADEGVADMLASVHRVVSLFVRDGSARVHACAALVR